MNTMENQIQNVMSRGMMWSYKHFHIKKKKKNFLYKSTLKDTQYIFIFCGTCSGPLLLYHGQIFSLLYR
jgi:hypothetical protein